MRLYFDMNIYNRIFDDQSQVRIRFESMAIDMLFELVENRNYKLAWSFILEYENSKNPFIDRRVHIESASNLAKIIIRPNNKIKLIARNVVKNSNSKDKDALHLASAIYGDCDYFITCDDKFINTIDKNRDVLEDMIGKIKLYNPIDFLRKEMNINVIE